MNILDAAIMGVVEGLTEFLPVSSTGHLILAGHFLKIQDSPDTKAFEIIVQGGAMLAVIWHYRRDLIELLRQACRGARPALMRLWALFVAFLPAAVVGLLIAKWIKAHLFGPGPVVAALIVGGVAMIVVERILGFKKSSHAGATEPNPMQAFVIGLFQCLAMWPGTSRSMTTILGGRIVGLGAVHAAGFSFLLAIPTLLAATGYDLLKHHSDFAHSSWAPLVVGTVVSFVVSLVVIRVFLNFLKKHSLEVFGWYRIVVGALLWIFL
jgi:undecaprenyl-diphosphatase